MGNVKKQLGAAVRRRRIRLDMSQEELAGRAKLHRTYISDVERGARNVSLESIHRLAAALEIPAALLFVPPDENGAESGFVPSLLPDELLDILVVEDSADDAERAVQALKSVGVANRIYVVRDGQAALDFLFCKGECARRKRTDRPQVVFLDLTLPKVEGIEVLRQLKADPQTRAIPVVVLGTSSRDHYLMMAQRLGAEAHIIKPVNFENLIGVTSRLGLQWALLKRGHGANA